MSGVELGVLVVAVVVGGTSATYRFTQCGRPPQTEYHPRLAWCRALVYFSACWAVAVATGTLGTMLDEPVVRDGQPDDSAWVAWTVGSVVTIVVAYWVVWGQWTLHFQRPRRWGWQVGFGLLWGSGTGLWFLTLWDLWARTDLPRWVVWVGAYVGIAAWQALFHDLYWDVYVTPEHDTPWSLTRKVVFTHVPNLTVTLTALTLFENRAVFVGLQTFALVGASVFMRFPAWGETAHIDAASTSPAFGGRLVRCTGWVTDDPHPYATQRRRSRAAASAG